MAELQIEGLAKRFGSATVLDGVELQAASGSLTAVLGPSGSGKTTLLRLVCGFERPDAGSITIAGRVVCAPGVFVPPEQRRIGYVPQEGALFPHLCVADNVAFGLPRAQRRARARVQALLEMVGLSADFANRAPQQLSGGQQQRVALARALAPSPALVLLDEPFSALDAALRAETRAAVAAALEQAGATGILVTHDQSEALSMGHQVAVLWEGRLVQLDTPHNVYRRPSSEALAAFVGEAVLLSGVCARGVVHCALGDLVAMSDTPQGNVQVLVRPEQIRVRPVDVCQGAASTAGIQATAIGVSFYGHDALVRLQLRDSSVVVTARWPGYRAVAVGEPVILAVEGEVTGFALGVQSSVRVATAV